MQFGDAYWLILIVLIPLFHKFWMGQNRPAKVNFPLPIPKKLSSNTPLRGLIFLKYIAIGCFIVALARPQNSYTVTERSVNGIDIMMVMDVSASMNIEDLSDRSRLDIAKDTMRDFVKGRENDRIGFVVFSGEAVTLAPPTLDYGLLMQAVGDARTGFLKDGTAIGDGLALTVGRLRDSKARSKVIILLTDGDNNVGQVDPATAGELAAGYNIKVYTIAIGREGRVKLPIRQKIGNQTITSYQWFENALNPELLQHIAKITNGRFYRVTDESTLNSVFKEIDSLEKTKVKSQEHIRTEELFNAPLKWGVLALALEKVLALGWWRVLP